jgi:iron complex outermembrane receptor protein
VYYLGRTPPGSAGAGNITLADFNTVQSLFFSCGGGPVPTITPRCWSQQPTNPVTTTGLFERAGDMARPSRYEEWGVAANVSLHLTDDLELKSITSYRSFIHDSSKDYDATASLLLWNAAFPRGKTFSEELQLNGRLFNDRAKFTLGAYHYRFNGIEDATNTQLQPLTGNNSANYLHDEIKNRSIGFFGQTTIAVTDQINITGGLRWTKDQKSISVSQYGSRSVSASTPLGYSCTLPIAPPNSNTNPALCVNTPPTLKYTSWDWTAGIDYKPMDNLMLYFRAAKGFQAGGINQRSVTGLDFVPYLPMSAINYELGVKADLFDRHLRINLSAFQNDVKNFQRSVASTFVFTVGGVPTSASVVAQINAATARIRGVEAEITWIPFEGARISGQVGHTDPKWIKFLADGPGGPKTLDLSFTDFQQIAKWTWGISPSYTLPVSFGELHFQADYTWQSTTNMQPALQYPTDREIPVPGLIQPGYGLLNGRIAARIGKDGATEIAVWGKNLTDKRYIIGGLNIAGTAGFAFSTVGNPRTFGVQVTHKF